MTCTITDLHRAADSDREFLRSHLTKPGSDFQRKLAAGQLDGTIAIVREHGEIIGWARSESWQDGHREWDTLEAFVARDHRHRGIASFAAAGLRSTVLPGPGEVAVFHPHMLLVARRAALRPTLFQQEARVWLRV